MFSSRTGWNLTTNRFTGAIERKRKAGAELLDLSSSNPTTCGFQYDQAAILAALQNSKVLNYQPDPRGLVEARAAVAAYYAAVSAVKENQRTVDLDDIILTTSTSEGYSFLFRLLCEPGDEVLIPRPSYPLFDFLATLNDVRLVPYSLIYDHGWQVDFHSLQRAITPKTKAVIVVHPNNPTGSYLKPHEVGQLNDICARAQLAIIADEVFLDFAILPQTTGSSLATNKGVLTFTLSGLSKLSGLPQMKMAWLVTVGPPAHKKEALARLEVIADTYLSMNAPVQLATPALLDLGRDFQQQVKARVGKNLAELDRQLSTGDSHGCERLALEAGWYAVLKVPATRSDEDLTIELVEKYSVIAHPGHFYEFESDGYLVLSLITPEREFAEGMARILKAV